MMANSPAPAILTPRSHVFADLLDPVQKPAQTAYQSLQQTPASVFIWGRRGRMGQELERLCRLNDLTVSDDPKTSLHLLAKSWKETPEYLKNLAPEISVIDLSGYLKMQNLGLYGLVLGGLIQSGEISVTEKLFANSGCMASAVIMALKSRQLDDPLNLDGPLHMTVTTSQSTAARHSEGLFRTGNRWADHPHVNEIRRALPKIEVASFVPVIPYQQPRGMLAVISGKLSAQGKATLQADVHQNAPEVNTILETARLATRLEINGDYFTLAVAADNLTLPAANAVLLAGALLSRRNQSP